MICVVVTGQKIDPQTWHPQDVPETNPKGPLEATRDHLDVWTGVHCALGVISISRQVSYELVLPELPACSLHRSVCGLDGNGKNCC